ncbi:MAG TPA: AraC family transcriptional regulator [Leeuwenhoekiella sp.]|nr:AraC family transcriptional regulator [Leeuwenhoekiella sp.]
MEETNKGYKDFRIAVPKPFQEIFSHFYFAENHSDEVITHTSLPSYQTILVFNFKNSVLLHSSKNTQIKIEKCLVFGPVKQAFKYSMPKNSELLVVTFKDDGFYRFFRNASVAKKIPVNPDTLLEENCFTSLWNELDKIEDVQERINILLEFWKPFVNQQDSIVEQLNNFSEENVSPIKSIALDNDQTERSIQLKHKKLLGYSDKEIKRYERFIKAIEYIQNSATKGSKIDWFEVVDACGYYDQSQLIHDFNYYINLTPTKYLKFQQDICNSGQ